MPGDFWKRGQKDYAISNYLRRRGYNVVEMRECEWQRLKHKGNNYAFIHEHFELPEHEDMTVEGFLREVYLGRFFGMVRCQVFVADEFRDQFADLPPIFKNIEVGLGDIGEHMREFCEAHDLLSTPRRCLISSYGSNDILIGTPLLQWYLQHDVDVAEVHEAFEFKPKPCFADFITKATNIRRQADKDPETYGILGAMEKLKVNWCVF